MTYSTYRQDQHPNPKRIPVFELKQNLDQASFMYQGGLGLKYKINQIVDIETRLMYIITGDDEFDGGGDTQNDIYNMIKANDSDNFFTANLGLTFKLGKSENKEHLSWYDPLREINHRIGGLGATKYLVCETGDKDNDAVCDDWDRQLNTPKGARVDGAGVALDIDMDGVIDLYDKCVTVPGTIENNGCPGTAEKKNVVDAKPVAGVTEINKFFEGIEFAINSDVIRAQSFSKLNEAASIIKTLDSSSQYYIVGATDTRGSEEANKILSQKRANAVVKYLVGKGVSSSMLIADGRGETDLKYPECNPATKCPEWKNEANRRVFFQAK